MNNENTNNESIIIEDLAAENANEIKGGPSTQSKRILILKSTVAGEEADGESAAFNHNETVSEDNDAQELAAVNDLPISEDREAQIKGGPTFENTLVSSVRFNHNETVSEDDEAEAQKLADLAVGEDTETEIKGGLIGLLLPAVQKAR